MAMKHDKPNHSTPKQPSKPDATKPGVTKSHASHPTASRTDKAKSASPPPVAPSETTCGTPVDERRHEGKIVRIAAHKLVATCAQGKEHTLTVAPHAQVCCDGTACQTSDLQVGERIRWSTDGADSNVATRIETLKDQTAFAT